MAQMTSERDPRTFAIIGAAMEVHRHLGCGFLEAVYREALSQELTERGIPFVREVVVAVLYKGQRLNVSYRADLVCYDSVIVDLKALPRLTNVEVAQLINYLKATGNQVGLLLNFGRESLEFRRLIYSTSAQSNQSVKSAESADTPDAAFNHGTPLVTKRTDAI